jgi:hypothetical protein
MVIANDLPFEKIGMRRGRSCRTCQRRPVFSIRLRSMAYLRSRSGETLAALADGAALNGAICALRAGRERVDPGPGHDDLCNSAAIALSLADNKRGPIEIPDEVLRWASIPSAPAWG